MSAGRFTIANLLVEQAVSQTACSWPLPSDRYHWAPVWAYFRQSERPRCDTSGSLISLVRDPDLLRRRADAEPESAEYVNGSEERE